MSRFTKFFAVLFLLPANAFSQDHFDVNKAYWGMSPLEVQVSVGRPPDWRGREAGYYRLMSNNRTYKNGREYWSGRWHYSFHRNEFVSAIYQHFEASDCHKNFNTVKASWTRKAGKKPKESRKTIYGSPARQLEWVRDNRTRVKLQLWDKPIEDGTCYRVVFQSVKHKA